MRPVSNPPNPWSATHSEPLEAPRPAELKIFEEEAKSILSSNDSPDIGFKYSLNPYRGCTHACAYCYARPSHQYLGFGAGTDFESKIVVKVNAAKLLRDAFMKKSWQGETVVFSGNTDCYQPLEASYKLTRACLEVCAEFRNPVSIITKSGLVARDADLLVELSRHAKAHVNVSIGFLDEGMARLMEPGAPPPRLRFEAVEKLARAGVSVGVGVAPMIPGLNDGQISGILKRAKEAGARYAFRTFLRLPAEVKDVFIKAVEERFPTHAEKILGRVREARGGKLYDSRFGARMRGQGPNWQAADDLFKLSCKRWGLNQSDEDGERLDDFKSAPKTFARPEKQLNLL